MTYANITLTPSASYGWLSATSTTLANPTYTVSASPVTYNNKVDINSNGIKMSADSDLMIGTMSLKETLHRIEQRLAILSPDKKLEEEWDELKRLGDEYRKLEADIHEKMKSWNILKK